MTSTVSSIMSVTASMTSTASAAATSQSQGVNNNNNNDDGGGGRPLLFFVALGFGVVFTNLWIIVGVKYCFRYNQRARAGQIDAETGEPIDLNNLPRQRRKREKKLMSMNEVNERFPLTKYKLWRATREQEGLPAAGGVTAPPSRAASIKETMLERTSTEVDTSTFAEDQSRLDETVNVPELGPSTDRRDFAATTSQGSEELPTTTHEPVSSIIPSISENTDQKSKSTTNITTIPTTSAETPAATEEEDEDPITTAMPASTANELLQNPGDACAICIDTLEDDDEIRGLTCGHAFHAGCLDPWLTSRRACCPLCKADYYVPKPRPLTQADAAIEDGIPVGDSAGRRRRARFMGHDTDTLQAPGPIFMSTGRPGFPSRRGILLPSVRRHTTAQVDGAEGADAADGEATQEHQRPRPRWGMGNVQQSSFAYRQRAAERAAERAASQAPRPENATETPEVQTQTTAQPQTGRFVAFSNRFRRNRNQTSTVDSTEETTTPGQLEAGTRS